MDLLFRIASWLGKNEATMSAVVGIMVRVGALCAGLRSALRRRGEPSAEKLPTASAEAPSTSESPSAVLYPACVAPLVTP